MTNVYQNIVDARKRRNEGKVRKYQLRYSSELRYFDKLGDDYIHLEFKGKTHSSAFFQAESHHRKYYKNEKCKINVLDNKHPEHRIWCVESQIIEGK